MGVGEVAVPFLITWVGKPIRQRKERSNEDSYGSSRAQDFQAYLRRPRGRGKKRGNHRLTGKNRRGGVKKEKELEEASLTVKKGPNFLSSDKGKHADKKQRGLRPRLVLIPVASRKKKQHEKSVSGGEPGTLSPSWKRRLPIDCRKKRHDLNARRNTTLRQFIRKFKEERS